MVIVALSITWIVLSVPCTFAEPIALQLRSDGGNVYLHAQIFTATMYVAASICMLFLRVWKIQEKAKGGSLGEGPKIETTLAAGGIHGSRRMVGSFWAWEKV